MLLAWIVLSRAYKLVAGAVAAVAASCALTYLIDPLAWAQYGKMAHASGIESEWIPCPASLLRFWISPTSLWLQFLPALLGCVWALAYFWPRRRDWNWIENGAPLLLVSLAVAPYAWIYDHGMVLPALLPTVFRARSRNLLIALASIGALIEVALFYSRFYPPALYRWTIWAAPVWLAWYLAANAPQGTREKARSLLLAMGLLRKNGAAASCADEAGLAPGIARLCREYLPIVNGGGRYGCGRKLQHISCPRLRRVNRTRWKLDDRMCPKAGSTASKLEPKISACGCVSCGPDKLGQ